MIHNRTTHTTKKRSNTDFTIKSGVNSGDRFVFGGYAKCRIDSKLNI
jgi:hypothetical protein